MSSIDKFIDSYWKLPVDPGVTQETYLDYLDSLKEKHGNNVIEQYKTEMLKGGSQKIFDVIFCGDILEDVFPNASLRARKTLKSLLNYLGQKKEPFTLFDFGSGDGMITIGLSAYLENLEKVYAIDLSPYAMPLLRKNLGKLPDEYRRKAENKLDLYTGDFNSSEITKMICKDVNVGLIAYPYDLNGAVDSFSAITKKGSEIIVSIDAMMLDHNSYDDDDLEGLSYIPINEINRSFQYSGVYFSYLDSGIVSMEPESLFVIASAIT